MPSTLRLLNWVSSRNVLSIDNREGLMHFHMASAFERQLGIPLEAVVEAQGGASPRDLN